MTTAEENEASLFRQWVAVQGFAPEMITDGGVCQSVKATGLDRDGQPTDEVYEVRVENGDELRAWRLLKGMVARASGREG